MLFLLCALLLIINSFVLRREFEKRRGASGSAQILESVRITPTHQLSIVILQGAQYLIGTAAGQMTILPLIKNIEGEK
jgi:flagellar biogenesis protein FliO